MDLDAKLKILQKRKLAEDSKEILQGYQDDLVNLRIEDEWLKNPNTIKLKEIVLSQLNSSNSHLIGNEDLDSESRSIIYKHKEMLLVFLAVLTNDAESELKTLESKINYEL